MKKQPASKVKEYTSRTIAKKIAVFASDKKAEDILILDMRKLVNFCDYFVLCSGNTHRQVEAIVDHVTEGLRDLGRPNRYSQAMKKSDWIVFDTGDVVVHVFQKQVREFYQLEYLWKEAKHVNWAT